MRSCLLLVLAICWLPTAAQSQGPSVTSDDLRGSLEESFREATGLGFASFDCEIPADFRLGQEIACEAVDEEGDRFFYRVATAKDGGDTTFTAAQPIEQLTPTGRASLERPCVAFLEAFRLSAWPSAHSALSPELQQELSLTDLQSMLEALGEAFGEIRSVEAETYASPAPGVHRLEYSIATASGDAVARFRLHSAEDGTARILAFLLTARPGSSLQGSLLEATGRRALEPLLERLVTRIEAPLHELVRIFDAVEGAAVLADGTKIPIRVEQHSSAWDLDGNDYGFQVLDVPWLLRRHLESAGSAPVEIDCPSRVAPDGGHVDCVVTVAGGDEARYTVSRRGGEHRLLDTP